MHFQPDCPCSIRRQHFLIPHTDYIQKPVKSPGYLLGEVMQLRENWISRSRCLGVLPRLFIFLDGLRCDFPVSGVWNLDYGDHSYVLIKFMINMMIKSYSLVKTFPVKTTKSVLCALDSSISSVHWQTSGKDTVRETAVQ